MYSHKIFFAYPVEQVVINFTVNHITIRRVVFRTASGLMRKLVRLANIDLPFELSLSSTLGLSIGHDYFEL